MSWVANVMLSVSPWDHVAADEFSEWLRAAAPRREGDGKGCGFLARVTGPDSQWGGWKNPECSVWAGVLNHADLDAVVAHARQMAWRRPLEVQLLIMDQEESFFRLWMFRDGGFRQYAPTRPDEEDPACYPPEN